MKIAVVYASKGGNTKKIAQAIANELSCEALPISADATLAPSSLEGYDLVFLGTGIHAGIPNQGLLRFLETAKISSGQKFCLFLTWGGAGNTNKMVLSRLTSILRAKNAIVLDNTFACFGGWKLLRRGHPTNEEVAAARSWAKKTVLAVFG